MEIQTVLHLACSASDGIDLFLIGDKQLMGLDAPGFSLLRISIRRCCDNPTHDDETVMNGAPI